MDSDILQKAVRATKAGQNYCFATVIDATLKGTPRKSGAKMLVLEDGTSYGTIGGGRYEKAAIQECLKSIKSNQPNLVTYNYFGQRGQSICGGQIHVFIEPVLQKKHLIICGAGHIALPLSKSAKMLNLHVTIIDNRKTYANKSRFGHVDKILVGKHATQLARQPIDQNCYIMIVTQGNEYDYECLKTALKTPAKYIGVISSHTKKVKFQQRLKKELKTSTQALKRVSIPAGLDIGAETPEEIALSIISEIVSKINQSQKGSIKFKNK